MKGGWRTLRSYRKKSLIAVCFLFGKDFGTLDLAIWDDFFR